MNIRPLLIAVSLAANAALAWLLWRGESPRAAVSPATQRVPNSFTGEMARARNDAARPAAAAKTDALTPEATRDRLKALGFPEDVIRAVVRAMIEEPRLAREREFYAASARQPWWRGAQNFTAEQDRELRALRKTERTEILRLLGPLGYAADEQLERYSFLPAEKAARLAVLQRDYADLRRELADGATAGNAEARERQKTIAAEHESDLAGLLTPTERAQFDERESSSARTLGYRFDYFNATEAEYRAVLALQKAFDETAPRGPSGEADRAFWSGLSQLGTDIAAALGPERFAAYLQAQRSEYRALVDLQRRYDIPQPTFDQVARLHLEVSAESARIGGDEALSNAEKRAALIALSEKATAGVLSTLGPTLGGTYLAGTRSNWIDYLAKGSSYGTQAMGGTSVRSFPDRPPVGTSGPPPPKS